MFPITRTAANFLRGLPTYSPSQIKPWKPLGEHYRSLPPEIENRTGIRAERPDITPFYGNWLIVFLLM
jgi:hypothetical protein